MKLFDRFKSTSKEKKEPSPQPAAAEPSVLEPSTVVEAQEVKSAPVNEQVESAADKPAEAAPAQDTKAGLFSRLKKGLQRTSSQLGDGVGRILLGKKEIDDELMEELETQLVLADVGIDATREIIANLTGRISRRELADAAALFTALKSELSELLKPSAIPLQIDSAHKPYVILMVGVNGVGKTTTIGKLTKRFQAEGRSVMLAAGDTFRAAAVEQLQVWGERNDVPVVAQHSGADSASVIFDALQAARSRKIDVLIADTAGRLHNKDNLMEELKKVIRVMGKLDASAPHEVMLVLDAGTGQNAMAQAKHFQEAAGVTGITLTKLDGTAKGGIIFAISKQLQLPIRFIGVGEQVDDLRPFVAEEFVEAVFGDQSPDN
jgi:fused signal recognition particle receptor